MIRILALTLLLCTALGVNAALADSWSRSGPRMSVDRTYDGSGSGTVTRELQNGATASRSTSCSGTPWAAGCSSTVDVETRNGNEFSAERNAAATRFRGGSVTTVTGPQGNTVVAPRRWRW